MISWRAAQQLHQHSVGREVAPKNWTAKGHLEKSSPRAAMRVERQA